MVSFPNCKINFGLSVLRKRPDGYHDISSVFVPVSFTDVLEIVPSSSFSFESTGIEIPDGGTNSCVKAWELLHRDFEIGSVSMFLLKNIPTGGGLGGGSSDGAFALKMLNVMFGLQLSTEQLEMYALDIGSDCPFFIRNKPVVAEGRGERFSSLTNPKNPLAKKYVLMIFPGIHISTPLAYSQLIPKVPDILPAKIWQQPISTWKDYMVNDFEQSVFTQHPELQRLKAELYHHGAAFSAMSGSGSTVFGVFDDVPDTRWLKGERYVLAQSM